MESEENIDRIIGFKKAFKRNRHALRLVGHGSPRSASVHLLEGDLGIWKIDYSGSDVAVYCAHPTLLSRIGNAFGDLHRASKNRSAVSIVSMGQFVGLEIGIMDNKGLEGLLSIFQLIEDSISSKVHSLDRDY